MPPPISCRRSLATINVVLLLVSQVSSQPPQLDNSKTFASLEEIFSVFSKAGAERDWRPYWSCHTSEAQDHLCFETYFACKMRPNDKELTEILKKYGVEADAVEIELARIYKQKGGFWGQSVISH